MVMKQKTMSFKEVVACCLRQKALIKNTASVLPLWEEIWLFLHSSDCVPILAHALYLSLFFPPFHLLFSVTLTHSCLMRRSRTAKRMNHAEWVPAVLLCPCVSALWSAVLAVIRARANSRGKQADTRRSGTKNDSCQCGADVWYLSLVGLKRSEYF